MLDNPKTKLLLVCGLASLGEALLIWWNWRTFMPSSAAMDSLKAILFSGGTFAVPSIRAGFIELAIKVLWLNLFTLLDLGINLWVIALATKRKCGDYPPHQNKVAWIAALWFAFLVVQVPTGIPSALAYWVFIARPMDRARRAS